ncbi:hypothetical protein V1264_009865 [Littorina saxatilis]|uniref:Sulfotransferase family protein n=1 Tax=Littorina saxatilis TaxID=31220 RepID=A0AAN9FZR1_9CAEN
MTSLSGQKRIMLWSVPRSLSTAMCRVMLNSGLTTKVMFEPYGNSYHFGPERVSTRYPRYPIDPSKSYSNIKKRQELPYDDKELVFVKNMAYHLAPDRLTAEWIPDGFTHTFIIRNPRSTIISKLKVHNNFTGWNYDPRESGYQEQVQIAHVLQQLGHRLVVIDADDLMENPEGILRAYCREVGLEFKPSMIHWEPLSEPDFQETFLCGVWEPSWFDNVRTASGLYPKPKMAAKDTGNDVSYDAETRDLIGRSERENTKYYEELYALRLTA